MKTLPLIETATYLAEASGRVSLAPAEKAHCAEVIEALMLAAEKEVLANEIAAILSIPPRNLN